jgi:outer membrane immunogenic protein
MKKTMFGGMLLATTMMAAPAMAQDAAASPFAGPYAGVHLGIGQVESLHTDRDDYWTNSKDGVTKDTGKQLGIQAGYDMLFGDALVGVMGEATLGKMDSYSEISSGGSDIPQIYEIGTRVTRLGSVRAKAGFASGSLAAYGTVGFAFSNAKQRFVETYCDDCGVFAGKGDRSGIVYGMGFDYAVGNRMTLGLAYSTYDFGSKTHLVDGTDYRFAQDYKVRQLAFNANYRFGGLASAAPVADATAFTGPYVGIQAGRATVTNVSNDLDYYFYNDELQTRGRGAMVGVRAGYDHAFGPLLVGVLGEVSFGKVDSFNDTTGDPDDYYYSAGTRLSRLGSVRAKLGLASNKVAAFVTGGFAFSNARQRLENGWSDDYGYDERGDRSGMVLGLGAAYALSSKANIGVDFSSYDFGKRQHLLGGDTDYRMTDAYKIRTLSLSFNYGF